MNEQTKVPSHAKPGHTGRRVVFVALMALFITVGAVAAYQLITTQARYGQAQSEYQGLRQSFGPKDHDSTGPAEEDQPRVIDHAALAQVNPDYIGWLTIPGTVIDYPVVQGNDNVHYLTTTFEQTANPSGAIFADHQCQGGLAAQLCLLHGHNMKDGSMFASLNQYLDPAFEAQHSLVHVDTPDQGEQEYTVFAVKLTDVWDSVYVSLDQDQQASETILARYGAAPGGQVLALSTCTNSADRDERLIVYAVKY